MLSKKFNVEIDDLIKFNNIEDISNINIGRSILIPENNGSETIKKKDIYIVQQGDTLFSISNKFNIPRSKIIEYNKLHDDDYLVLGQELKITADLIENEIIVMDLPQSKSVPYWPISGNISDYSGRIQGVKIDGESGDYIKAVSKGKVIWYDSYKSIGKVVIIEGDNGYSYLYGYKDGLDVSKGIKVDAGDRIGKLKKDSTSIIFSVFKNGIPLNNISEAPR